MIREIIVVEGRDDIQAVKRAVDAEVIGTGGYGYNREFIENLKSVSKNRGVIILTDPDFAGEKIRKEISKDLVNCKHAFLPRGKAIKDGDIGVENASVEDIIEAIKNAKPMLTEKRVEFTKTDLIRCGLSGGNNSRKRRETLGKVLGIGYCNAKQFLNRLNNFGITREEFLSGIEGIDELDE